MKLPAYFKKPDEEEEQLRINRIPKALLQSLGPEQIKSITCQLCCDILS